MRLRSRMRRSLTLLRVLAWYWLLIFPRARQALARWHRRAKAIPDPALRALACTTFRAERLNSEGAALFAILAPPAQRSAATRLLVAYQVMYDYLDTLTEQPSLASLDDSRLLHDALRATVSRRPPRECLRLYDAQGDDGGYLRALIETCQSTFDALPSADTVRSYVADIIQISTEGQSQNHATMTFGGEGLREWAGEITPAGSGLRWWEAAAATGSSLAIHAMLASAANAQLTAQSARQLADAYWPWINCLHMLLESLIDKAEDAETGNHSYVSHYASSADAAERLGMVASRATAATHQLAWAREHEVILVAMVSFYLATSGAQTHEARPAAIRVREQFGRDVSILLAMLSVRRRLAR